MIAVTAIAIALTRRMSAFTATMITHTVITIAITMLRNQDSNSGHR